MIILQFGTVVKLRRLRYLGHILRMPERRVVRRALVALAKGGSVYPKGSLFMDCQKMKIHQLVALAQRCVERTGQTTTMRRTATVPLDPLGLIWNAYIQAGFSLYFVIFAFKLLPSTRPRMCVPPMIIYY